ncbi:hypothetical protein LMH87_001317 [Akanthomyces muscarius]|uniref:BZIP domain-containing protein n=1 Tax=Akanthomyces muscarius TaxID=2231603 RepID=A0A9W8QGA5_AKAMU|nr:hypothetical protein LMH87_001317 [Akanthomyces muscarius]KAJ4156104.1 hypothetical protein LMH87_001317 [Akanthomyces muscarius]
MTDFTDLESLLSAASYPDCPPPHQSIRSLGQTPAPRFQSENASPLREWRVNVSRKPRENTSGVSQRSSIQQTKRQPVASSIKGDASAAVNSTDDRKKEKRRRQVRLAQRAYRNRQTSTVSSLSARNVRLESALSDVASTMVGLRDMLYNSNASILQPDYGSFCFASEQCLSRISELGVGLSLHPGSFERTPSRPPFLSPVFAFSDRNDALPQHAPEKDLVDDYFIGEWDDVPIFTIGARVGSRASAKSTALPQQPPEQDRHRWRRVEVPLEALPENIRSQYEGSWLDAEQLEAYLRTKNVRLYSPSSNTDPRMLTRFGNSAVNITRLIAELLDNFYILVARNLSNDDIKPLTRLHSVLSHPARPSY